MPYSGLVAPSTPSLASVFDLTYFKHGFQQIGLAAGRFGYTFLMLVVTKLTVGILVLVKFLKGWDKSVKSDLIQSDFRSRHVR